VHSILSHYSQYCTDFSFHAHSLIDYHLISYTTRSLYCCIGIYNQSPFDPFKQTIFINRTHKIFRILTEEFGVAARFSSCLAILSEVFRGLPGFLQTNAVILPQLSHGGFLQMLSNASFTCHPRIRHYFLAIIVVVVVK
jgi:hypothetical protein